MGAYGAVAGPVTLAASGLIRAMSDVVTSRCRVQPRADAYLVGGFLPVVRNVSGMTGIGLSCA